MPDDELSTSPTSSGTESHTSETLTDSAFDSMLQSSPIGRLSITIIAGRQLHVSSIHSEPYCLVEFERNEFVTRAPIREGGALHQRSGGPLNFLDSPTWKHTVTFDVAHLNGKVYVSVYERVPEQQEIFLGYVTIEPPRKNNEVIDDWYKLCARDKTPVGGEVQVRISYETVEKTHLTPDSFEVLKSIGKGNFGKVFQIRKKDTGRIYVMKVLHKQDLIERREYAMAENILVRAKASPFLIGLKFSFQTRTHLYLVTDFMNGDELLWHLQNEVRFSEVRAKYYAAEIVLALEHLHKHNIVYRDLQPENILLDAAGHIALCHFGLCKENHTISGSPEYLAPEVLFECGYGNSADWWSLGILFYEMIAGFSPFYTNDTQLMYRRIPFGKLKFPRDLFSDEAKSLIRCLLARNPAHRLGSHHDAQEIKNHPFFAEVDWNMVANKQFTPLFKPIVTPDEDMSCPDPAFTEEGLPPIAQQ